MGPDARPWVSRQSNAIKRSSVASSGAGSSIHFHVIAIARAARTSPADPCAIS
jgi:hypothetical protein